MLVLKVTTHEDFATVRWFKDGEEVKNVRKRNQRMKTLSTECQHILAVEKCLTSDAGTYRAETNSQVTTTIISVVGESSADQSPHLGCITLYWQNIRTISNINCQKSPQSRRTPR